MFWRPPHDNSITGASSRKTRGAGTMVATPRGGPGRWRSDPREPRRCNEPGTLVLRVRALIVVDSAGRDRMFLGAPVPDPREGKRISPSVGLTVNDSAGNERFGLGLQSSGRFTM